MKYIDEERIHDLLAKPGSASQAELDRVLAKAASLKRLSLEEAALLLCERSAAGLRKIEETARGLKEAVYGRRVVLFVPLYVSNVCVNNCLYCSFKADNPLIERRILDPAQIRRETELLLGRGHKRILMVAGEAAPGKSLIDYYVEGIEAIYSARSGRHRIRRVNINCAPLSVGEFRRLKAAGIGTYQLFQETYHEATYRQVHPSGPKSDPDNRITAIDRAFEAGIDDVGIGALYGLYDWRFEVLAMLMHVEHLEKRFGVGPHTISVPRIEPALGAEFSRHPLAQVSDEEFRQLVAVLRLAVPYTGIILSTRESPAMRDELFALGVSQVSAESRTSPGGYSSAENAGEAAQFCLSDQRSLDEIIGALIARGFIPSFCAACYRKERTGKAFMKLARPGLIKGKCSMNALITLKEYLDDFASKKVREAGYGLIGRMSDSFDGEERKQLCAYFDDIDRGLRDEYV